MARVVLIFVFLLGCFSIVESKKQQGLTRVKERRRKANSDGGKDLRSTTKNKAKVLKALKNVSNSTNLANVQKPRTTSNVTKTARHILKTTKRKKTKLGKKTPQRVVIIPGPHKTGVSSVQRNLVDWTRSKAIKGWTWPTMKEEGWESGKDYWRLVADSYFGSKARQEKYSKLFRESWTSGKSIVFGSDAFDNVLSHDSQGELIMNNVLGMMPWKSDPKLVGSDAHVTVVVSYRARRVDHLVSIWKQVGQWGESFSHFILSLPETDRQWHRSLNPLGLADAFIRKGLVTVVVDSSGLRRERLNLSNVIACEVMNSTSCKNNVVSSPFKENRMKLIAKDSKGTMDVDKKTLKLIDDVLLRVDDSYCSLKGHKKLVVLHQHELFSRCEEKKIPKGGIDTKEAAKLIRNIVSKSITSGPTSKLKGETETEKGLETPKKKKRKEDIPSLVKRKPGKLGASTLSAKTD